MGKQANDITHNDVRSVHTKKNARPKKRNINSSFRLRNVQNRIIIAATSISHEQLNVLSQILSRTYTQFFFAFFSIIWLSNVTVTWSHFTLICWRIIVSFPRNWFRFVKSTGIEARFTHFTLPSHHCAPSPHTNAFT